MFILLLEFEFLYIVFIRHYILYTLFCFHPLNNQYSLHTFIVAMWTSKIEAEVVVLILVFLYLLWLGDIMHLTSEICNEIKISCISYNTNVISNTEETDVQNAPEKSQLGI